MYIYIYIFIYIEDMYVNIYGSMYMYVCVCVYIYVYTHLKKTYSSQRLLDLYFSEDVTNILTPSPQYTDSNTPKIHKITDL